MRYQRIVNEQQLLHELASPDAAILCGGTDVIVKMRAGILRPQVLLDVSHLDSLKGIRVAGSDLLIGAAALESDIMDSPLVQQHAPLLVSVLAQLGSVQIRNRGTLGGNIVNASPAADSAIPLLLYDTQINIVGPDAERWTRLENFFVAPGKTRLETGEFIRQLRLPITKQEFVSFFHKVGKRNALTIAIASLGVLLRVDEGVIRECRLAVGSVAPTPRRLRELESQLSGRRLEPSTINDARARIVEAIAPISDVRATADYRKNVIGELMARALSELQR